MKKLDIHGLRFHEAIESIESFIDLEFFHNPGTTIELVTGLGVIRKEVLAILGSHQLVKEYKDNRGSFVIYLEDR